MEIGSLKMSLRSGATGLEWALNPITGDLTRQQEQTIDTQRGDCCGMMEAGIRGIRPQAKDAKDCWQLSEARREVWVGFFKRNKLC